jgi:hypothetical protein
MFEGGTAYLDRYQHLDQMSSKVQEAKTANPKQSFEESLKARVNAFGGEEQLNWIYGNDIEEVWQEFLEEEKLNQVI